MQETDPQQSGRISQSFSVPSGPTDPEFGWELIFQVIRRKCICSAPRPSFQFLTFFPFHLFLVFFRVDFSALLGSAVRGRTFLLFFLTSLTTSCTFFFLPHTNSRVALFHTLLVFLLQSSLVVVVISNILYFLSSGVII
jgi:hypothetical protein